MGLHGPAFCLGRSSSQSLDIRGCQLISLITDTILATWNTVYSHICWLYPTISCLDLSCLVSSHHHITSHHTTHHITHHITSHHITYSNARFLRMCVCGISIDELHVCACACACACLWRSGMQVCIWSRFLMGENCDHWVKTTSKDKKYNQPTFNWHFDHNHPFNCKSITATLSHRDKHT